MSFSSVMHLQGWLLLFLGAAMLTPILFSLYDGDSDVLALLASALVTAGAGALVLRVTRVERELRARDGFATVTFGWLLCSLFGMLPFLFSGAIPDVTDAFFETMSGFTTTGASILVDVEALPRGVLFWRSLTHWIGGMGIIVFSLAVLPFLGVGGMQLYKAEAAGPTADKLTPRIRETAKILWIVYLALTVVVVALLMIGGMNLFDALCHAFGTVATGGFSTKNTSIAYFDSTFVDWVVIVFMAVGASNFALHFRFLSRHWRAYQDDREWIAFMGSMVVASLVIGAMVLPGYEDKYIGVRDVVFTVATTQSSTGFALANYELWPSGAQFVLLLLMLIGGSAGSTAGGLKVVRVYLIFKHLGAEFTRLVHPQAVVPVRMRKVAVPRNIIFDVLGFAAVYMVAIFIGSLIVTSLGMDWISGISAVISAIGATGPGMNTVGPFDNYSALHPLAKWTLSACMLLGRLEFYSVLVLFAPAYWRK